MLTEVPRFHRRARALLEQPAGAAGDQTLRDFLADGGFSAYFCRQFMEPLVAAVWSLRPAGRPRLSRALPLRVPRPPRDALGHRLAPVADRRRWLPRLRRARRGRSRRGPARHQGDLGPRDGRRRRGDRRQRRHHVVRRGRGRHPPRPGAGPAAGPDSGAARGPRRDPLRRQPRPAAHRHLPAAARREGAGVVELPAPARRPGRGDRRPTTSPACSGCRPTTHYLVTLGGEDLVDPRTVLARMEYAHPHVQPHLGRRPAAAARGEHAAARLRRRLPRVGLPRGRRALRCRRGRAPRAVLGRPGPADAGSAGAGSVRRDDPAHAPAAVPFPVRAPVARLAGRPGRRARPRSARPLRGP